MRCLEGEKPLAAGFNEVGAGVCDGENGRLLEDPPEQRLGMFSDETSARGACTHVSRMVHKAVFDTVVIEQCNIAVLAGQFAIVVNGCGLAGFLVEVDALAGEALLERVGRRAKRIGPTRGKGQRLNADG